MQSSKSRNMAPFSDSRANQFYQALVGKNEDFIKKLIAKCPPDFFIKKSGINYTVTMLLAEEGDSDSVEFSLRHGGDWFSAVKGYAMGGWDLRVEEIIKKASSEYVRLGYMSAAANGYALRVRKIQLDKLLEKYKDIDIYQRAIDGYTEAGFPKYADELRKKIEEMEKEAELLKDEEQVSEIQEESVGEVGESESNDEPLEDLSQKEPETEVIKPTQSTEDPLQKEDKKIIEPTQSTKDPVQKEDKKVTEPTQSAEDLAQKEDKKIIEPTQSTKDPMQKEDKKNPEQKTNISKLDLNKLYVEQQSRQLKRLIWVALAAVFLTPLSLIITLPLWFKGNQIQKLETTDEEFAAVKEKRKVFRGDLPKIKDEPKLKKVLLSQEGNKRVYLVDKAQLARFKLFAKHDQVYLDKKRSKILKQVAKSKEESIKMLPKIR